jgi:hypothetical protein
MGCYYSSGRNGLGFVFVSTLCLLVLFGGAVAFMDNVRLVFELPKLIGK